MECKNCVFWDQWVNDKTKGSCRKHSPVVAADKNGDFSTDWPTVSSDDYCGDIEII